MVMTYAHLRGRQGIEVIITKGAEAGTTATEVAETTDAAVIDFAVVQNRGVDQQGKYATLLFWPLDQNGDIVEDSDDADAAVQVVAQGQGSAFLPGPVEFPFGFKWNMIATATSPTDENVSGHFSYAVVKKSVDASGVETT